MIPVDDILVMDRAGMPLYARCLRACGEPAKKPRALHEFIQDLVARKATVVDRRSYGRLLVPHGDGEIAVIDVSGNDDVSFLVAGHISKLGLDGGIMPSFKFLEQVGRIFLEAFGEDLIGEKFISRERLSILDEIITRKMGLDMEKFREMKIGFPYLT